MNVSKVAQPLQSTVLGRVLPMVRHAKSTLCCALGAAALAGPGAGQVQAQSTWTNGNAGALWATVANWTPSAPSTGVVAILPLVIPSGGGTITLPDGAVAGSLTVDNNYTLTGGQLALDSTGGPIVVASGSTATIGSTLNGTQGLMLSGGGTLKLTSDATLSNLTIGANDTDPVGSTLHLNGASATFSGSMLVQTNNNAGNASTGTNTIIIDSGEKLQIGGASVYLGNNDNAAVNTTTVVNFTGGGEFVYDRASNGIFQVGGHQAPGNTANGNNSATVDMSGLATATITVSPTAGTFRVGDFKTNGTGSQTSPGSTLTLAPNSTITANRVSIGADSSSQNSVHTLRLGAVKTEINANSFQVGTGLNSSGTQRGSGVVEFATGTGTLKIRAADAVGAATLDMVNNTENQAASNMSATMNLTGHNSDLLLSTFTLASRRNSSTGAGNATATFSFDTGTLAATSVIASRRIGTTTNPNTSGTMTSTMNLGGGTVTFGTLDLASNTANTSTGGGVTASVNISGGTVGISSIVMATTSGAPENTATSALNITGGVVTLGGNITRTVGGVGVENTTLTVDGGTLDMAGSSIGTAAAPVGSGNGALNLRAGTLKNVAEINGGAALDKSTGGTLVLGGTNSFSGDVSVSGGKWLVDGLHNNAGSYSFASGTTFGGSGTVNLVAGEQISVLGDAFVAPGGGYSATSPATSLNVGTLSAGVTDTAMSMNGTLLLDIASPLLFDELTLAGSIQISSSAIMEINGVTDFTQLDFMGDLGFVGGERIDLVTASLFSGDFSNFPLNTSIVDAGGHSVFFGHDSTALYIEVAAVPEPASLSLFGLGLAGLALVRRRNR